MLWRQTASHRCDEASAVQRITQQEWSRTVVVSTTSWLLQFPNSVRERIPQ